VGFENAGSFTFVLLAVLLTTSFLKIFTTLTLLRFGIGINQWEGGVIVACVSLALTFFVMDPVVSFEALSNDAASFPNKISPFLRTHTDSEVYQRLARLRASGKSSSDSEFGRASTVESTESDSVPPNQPLDNKEAADVTAEIIEGADSARSAGESDPNGEVAVSSTEPQLQEEKTVQTLITSAKANKDKPDDFSLLVASFTVSQVRDAFEIGFLLLVPFLLVDLLVMNFLMILGARAISVELISVPLKIMLFFSVDGWTLVSEKLLKEFL